MLFYSHVFWLTKSSFEFFFLYGSLPQQVYLQKTHSPQYVPVQMLRFNKYEFELDR